MKLRFIFFSLILSISAGKAQNFPYLNASTGNAGQSFTDADTNIYMYHSNRLAKFTKNLAPVWVKTYNNLSLQNVLLSKTGSLYFIGDNAKVGKLDATGNLVWAKTINNSTVQVSSTNYTLSNANGSQLFLDRNNNLVVTGVSAFGFFMKLDTAGNILNTTLFTNSNLSGYDHFNVINDSLGNYKIYADGIGLGGVHGFVLNYSDVANTITKNAAIGVSAGYGGGTAFYKSRFGSNFYIGSSPINNVSVSRTWLLKFNTHKSLWSCDLGFWGPYNVFESMQEDEQRNVLLVSSGYGSQGMYSKGYLKFDSAGIYNGVSAKYFINDFSSPNIPSSQVHALYSGKYFWDATGFNFPSNPLTIGTTTMGCTTAMPNGTLSSGQMNLSYSIQNLPVTYTVSAITTPTFTSSATAITNFSVAANFCIVMSEAGNNLNDQIAVDVYPNPCTDLITVKLNEGTADLTFMNILGEALSVKEDKREGLTNLNTKDLFPGIYFLIIQSGTRKLVKKIIKR